MGGVGNANMSGAKQGATPSLISRIWAAIRDPDGSVAANECATKQLAVVDAEDAKRRAEKTKVQQEIHANMLAAPWRKFVSVLNPQVGLMASLLTGGPIMRISRIAVLTKPALLRRRYQHAERAQGRAGKAGAELNRQPG